MRRAQSVVSSGQLLATVRVGVLPDGRTQLAWPSSSCSEGQCLRCSGVVISLLLLCVMVDVLHCMDLEITAPVVAHVFMRCIKKRAWRATTHAENCERLDDEIRAWYRQKGEKSKLQGKLTMARLRSSCGYPKLKAKGAATRHMASFALGLAARHCAGPSVLDVVQTLAEIYHTLEKEGMFLSDAAKTRLSELARQFHLLYNRLPREAVAEVPVWSRSERCPRRCTCSSIWWRGR